MKPEGHQEIYRVAFETASSELTEISVEVERLRARLGQVERLVAVLKPLVVEENETAETPAAELTAKSSEVLVTTSSETKAEPIKVVSDPFQRRIDHVLGIGAGIRDVRSYTRQF